jgi:hypothetical protein
MEATPTSPSQCSIALKKVKRVVEKRHTIKIPGGKMAKT